MFVWILSKNYDPPWLFFIFGMTHANESCNSYTRIMSEIRTSHLYEQTQHILWTYLEFAFRAWQAWSSIRTSSACKRVFSSICAIPAEQHHVWSGKNENLEGTGMSTSQSLCFCIFLVRKMDNQHCLKCFFCRKICQYDNFPDWFNPFDKNMLSRKFRFGLNKDMCFSGKRKV